MSAYITQGGFKLRHNITTDTHNGRITEHCAAASLEVDSLCGRHFGQHSGDATARYFTPYSSIAVRVDDCYGITQVAIDLDDSGTYATVLSASDYTTEPANGIGPNGQSGWPVEEIRLVTFSYSLRRFRRPSVKVTAKWGWEATPSDVTEASYLVANRLFYEVAVPSGITAPNPEFGLPGTPLQRPYTVERLLAPYRRMEKVIGVAG